MYILKITVRSNIERELELDTVTWNQPVKSQPPWAYRKFLGDKELGNDMGESRLS